MIEYSEKFSTVGWLRQFCERAVRLCPAVAALRGGGLISVFVVYGRPPWPIECGYIPLVISVLLQLRSRHRGAGAS